MDKHNGWTNFATWAVALHINNDQGAQSLVEEWAQECWDRAEASKQTAINALADLIEEWVSDEIGDAIDEIKHHPWASLLIRDLIDTSADWREIAETFIAELA